MQPLAPSARPAGSQDPVSGQLRIPEALAGLRQQRVDVVGLASVEGAEMAAYLLAAGFSQVVAHDRQPDLAALADAHQLAHAGLAAAERRQRLEQLLEQLSAVQLGEDYLAGVADSRLVIPTQAWFIAEGNQELHRLRAAGHPFYSLIQAYLDLCLGPVVGITGSHGKSTTSSLVAAMARHSGAFGEVWLAGNDRHNRQALQQVAGDRGDGCLVLEISNRQLLQLESAPGIACITNITENHLDEHQGLEGYIRTKRRIFELPGCRSVVLNADDPISQRSLAAPGELRQLRFGLREAALGDCDGSFEEGAELLLRQRGERLQAISRDSVPLLGAHNLANTRAAIATFAALAAPDQAQLTRAAAGIAGFSTLAHRLQLIWQAQGVNYYDDLSSTTPQSTVAAVRALGRPCVLICGGQDKGIDFAELVGQIPDPVRQLVLLPGAGSEKLLQAAVAAGHQGLITRASQLAESVVLARGLVRPGEAVLLSPACPGFFTAHYQDGGFRRAVRSATSPRPQTGPG